MASQLGSGRWLASRVESGKRVLRVFESEEDAVEFENG